MTLIRGILTASGTVFLQMAPFLVLGFFLAGWLYVLLPRETVASRLGANRRWGPLWAALVGIPLPLCSCGVLPFARLLKDRKASPGSIVSFLLTTPQTGADSILVSASILGWPLTLWKVGTAFVSGVLGGFTANALHRDAGDIPDTAQTSNSGDCGPVPIPGRDTQCCGSGKALHAETNPGLQQPCQPTHEAIPNPQNDQAASDADAGCSSKAPLQQHSCCGEAGTASTASRTAPGKLRTALYYGFFQNLGDVAGWLVWGILGAGAIAYAVPEEVFSKNLHSSWLEMLVILAISIPLYVCATGSIPIGAALFAKGLSAGAVMVFLIAGPAMSAVSLAVLGRTLGRRLLLIYLSSIVVLSVASGLAFNALFPSLAQSLQPVHEGGHFDGWQIACGALLGSLLLLHFFQRTARKMGKPWLRICPDCLSFCPKGCVCCGCAH